MASFVATEDMRERRISRRPGVVDATEDAGASGARETSPFRASPLSAVPPPRRKHAARASVGARASVARNLPTDVVVTHPRANKGDAALALAAHLGIGGRGPGALLGVGDSGNDVPMLRAVGVGVAMANARRETLAAAEFATRATNEDALCGVLEVVRAVVAARG